MILSVTYSEIVDLVRRKSGQEIGLKYKDIDTVTLSLEVPIPLPVIKRPLNSTVSADVRIVQLALPRAVIEIDAGGAGNLAVNLLSKKFLERLPEGLVESFADGRLALNLAALPKARKLLSTIRIDNISFYESSLAVEAGVV